METLRNFSSKEIVFYFLFINYIKAKKNYYRFSLPIVSISTSLTNSSLLAKVARHLYLPPCSVWRFANKRASVCPWRFSVYKVDFPFPCLILKQKIVIINFHWLLFHLWKNLDFLIKRVWKTVLVKACSKNNI